jgi:hypothetical protein
MLDTKRQRRVAKEMAQQRRASREAAALSGDGVADGVDVVRGEVGEPAVLEVRPELLGRVEFGRVGREPDDVPRGMPYQPGTDQAVLVRLPEIPHQHDRSADMAA